MSAIIFLPGRPTTDPQIMQAKNSNTTYTTLSVVKADKGLLIGEGTLHQPLHRQIIAAQKQTADHQQPVTAGNVGIDSRGVIPDDAASRRLDPAAEAAHAGGNGLLHYVNQPKIAACRQGGKGGVCQDQVHGYGTLLFSVGIHLTTVYHS